jgi:hypothetical protein
MPIVADRAWLQKVIASIRSVAGTRQDIGGEGRADELLKRADFIAARR